MTNFTREKVVHGNEALALRYFGDLVGVDGKVASKDVITSIRENIMEKASFDFTPVVEACVAHPDLKDGMKSYCKDVFRVLVLPDNMQFIGLDDYVYAVGTPFSKTTFGSGSLAVKLYGEEDLQLPVLATFLFKDCNLSALDSLNVEVSGNVMVNGAFSGCKLPAHTEIKIDIPKAIRSSLYRLFESTVFTGEASIKVNAKFERGENLLDIIGLSDEEDVSEMFRSTMIPDYVTVETDSCVEVRNGTYVRGYMCECTVGEGFRSPVVVPDDVELYLDYTMNHRPLVPMRVIPFFGTAVGDKSVYELCGLGELEKFDSRDRIAEHVDELEGLGFRFDEDLERMYLPKEFNKAFQMLHEGISEK